MFLGRVSSILNSNLESDRLLRPFSLRFSLPSNRPVNFILLFNQERDYESFIIVFFLRYLSNSGRTKTIYNTTRWHNVPGGGGACVFGIQRIAQQPRLNSGHVFRICSAPLSQLVSTSHRDYPPQVRPKIDRSTAERERFIEQNSLSVWQSKIRSVGWTCRSIIKKQLFSPFDPFDSKKEKIGRTRDANDRSRCSLGRSIRQTRGWRRRRFDDEKIVGDTRPWILLTRWIGDDGTRRGRVSVRTACEAVMNCGRTGFPLSASLRWAGGSTEGVCTLASPARTPPPSHTERDTLAPGFRLARSLRNGFWDTNRPTLPFYPARFSVLPTATSDNSPGIFVEEGGRPSWKLVEFQFCEPDLRLLRECGWLFIRSGHTPILKEHFLWYNFSDACGGTLFPRRYDFILFTNVSNRQE